MIHLSEQNGGVFQNVDKVVEKVRSPSPMHGKAVAAVAETKRAEQDRLRGDNYSMIPFHARPP